MGRRADNSVYVTGETLRKVSELAALTSRQFGRPVTYGEVVGRAVEAALVTVRAVDEAREGAST